MKEHEEWQDFVAFCINDVTKGSSGREIRMSTVNFVRLAIKPANLRVYLQWPSCQQAMLRFPVQSQRALTGFRPSVRGYTIELHISSRAIEPMQGPEVPVKTCNCFVLFPTEYEM